MTNIKLILIAVVEFFKVFGPLMMTLVKHLNTGIEAIVEYFVLKNKRLKDLVKEEEVQKKVALEKQAALEKANVTAFTALIDESWKIKYNQMVKSIQAKDYATVLKTTVLAEGVDEILFDETKGAEYRATKIIGIMKKTE